MKKSARLSPSVSPPAPARVARSGNGPVVAAVALIIAAGLLAYANGLGGPFVYDDLDSITANPSIRHLWPLTDVLSPPARDGMTVGGRPLLNLTLALNYAFGGTAVGGYHALNVAIHLAAALTLFGLVRRTLRLQPALAGAGTPSDGSWIAAGVALLWVVHPLQTESVTYVVQRAESLMGLFYLQTLYAFVRHAETRGGSRTWGGWCVTACLLGMATKEVMVSAPLLVLLYDRAFLAGGFREAWRRHRVLYAALALTWLPLIWLVAGTGGSRGGSIGFGLDIGWWAHGLTQFRAIARYLWLSFWPHPLAFDYGPERILSVWDVLPFVPVVLAVIGATLLGLYRRAAWGFAGALFLAVLAPTSLIPGPIQMTVEHRMYLPLAVVLAASLFGLYRLVGRSALAGVLVVALVFGGLTHARNNDYRSELSLWGDTVAKRPDNPVALAAYASALQSAGRVAESVPYFERALKLNPAYPQALNNYATALFNLNRLPEAAEVYARSLQARPDRAYVQDNLARTLVKLGRLDEAVRHFAEAVRLEPVLPEVHSRYALALMELNRVPEAIEQYTLSLRDRPNDADTHFNLANALVVANRPADAVAQFERTLQLNPADAGAAANLADLQLALNRPAAAVATYEAALQRSPGAAELHARYGMTLLDLGRNQDAVDHLTRAVQLRPDVPEFREMLAAAAARRRASP